MIKDKLLLIADNDQQRWRKAAAAINFPAALQSAHHEDKMVERHEEQGSVRTIMKGREITLVESSDLRKQNISKNNQDH